MKTYDETYRSVLSKRDAYEQNKTRRGKNIKKAALSGALVLAAVFTAAICIRFFGSDPDIPEKISDVTEPVAENLTEEPVNELAADPFSEVGSTEPFSGVGGGEGEGRPSSVPGYTDGDVVVASTSERSDESSVSDDRSGGYSGENVSSSQIDPSAAYLCKHISGEWLTDEEAAAYFTENRQSVIVSLSSSGVDVSDVKIMEKGYGHLSISAAGGLEYKVNFRDYLVYAGPSLVAIVTLVKENGNISSTLSFGAPWFSLYNDFLQAHKGQELVYVYCDSMEYVITPDNRIVNPMGYEIVPEFFTQEIDYHSLLNEKVNVYVP
ncbi:MAG: hypothetical protein IJS90_08145 [Clostridia bacterium]|nr:hypothetical protein [Clostridia bacterium]